MPVYGRFYTYVDCRNTFANARPILIPNGRVHVHQPCKCDQFQQKWICSCTLDRVGPISDPCGLQISSVYPLAPQVANVCPDAPGNFHMGPVYG